VTYLVDSDWVATYLNGRREAIELLTRLAGEGLAISLITFGEIYEGIYYSPDPTTSEAGFRRFLHEIDVLPLNRPIMRRFARVRGHLRRTGQVIGDPDILIAATALHHDLTLLTRNMNHFQRIPDLRIYLPR